MFALLISLPISVAALWLGVDTMLRMRRLKVGWAWWAGLGGVVFFGGCAGFWLGNYELQISPSLRWVGLPMPIGFFVLEGESWTDFIPPRPIQWLNLLADCLGPILIQPLSPYDAVAALDPSGRKNSGCAKAGMAAHLASMRGRNSL